MYMEHDNLKSEESIVHHDRPEPRQITAVTIKYLFHNRKTMDRRLDPTAACC
jgi:hypothetical protein